MEKHDKHIDLHCHTTYSDGSETIEEILQTCANNGIEVLAITDHDTVEGMKSIEKMHITDNVNIIPAIEITVNDELHILGYYINIYNKELNDLLVNMEKNRYFETIQLIRKMEKNHMDISLNEVLKEYRNLNPLSIAKYMEKINYVDSKQEALEKYFMQGKVLYVEKKRISPKVAISAIHSAGGIASLAHPVTISKDENIINDVINDLKIYGLDAIECYNSKIDFYMQEKLFAIADKLGLEITGGSDYHGKRKKKAQIGKGGDGNYIPYSIYEKINNYYEHRLA